MPLHDALSGHWLARAPGLQMSAHCDGVGDPAVSSTHLGWAVAPSGTSVGHGEDELHGGEQNEPESPVICTASEPSLQGPAFGSP